MTPELKHIIEQISRETQYQKEQIVWGEFVHNIASADSIDAIAKNKRILCAYFGMTPDTLTQFCQENIHRLFPRYVENFKNYLIEWSEIEKFKQHVTDEKILEEIEKLSIYAADMNLLSRFIWCYNNGGSESELLEYLSQCNDKEIKTKMLSYLSNSKELPTDNLPKENKTVISHVNKTFKEELGDALMIGYNREEILKQYGLHHLIDKK